MAKARGKYTNENGVLTAYILQPNADNYPHRGSDGVTYVAQFKTSYENAKDWQHIGEALTAVTAGS